MIITQYFQCLHDDISQFIRISQHNISFGVRSGKVFGRTKKGLLQNVSFAAVLILPSLAVFCCVSGVKEQPVVYLEHSKADREASHGLAVDFSVCYLL